MKIQCRECRKRFSGSEKQFRKVKSCRRCGASGQWWSLISADPPSHASATKESGEHAGFLARIDAQSTQSKSRNRIKSYFVQHKNLRNGPFPRDQIVEALRAGNVPEGAELIDAATYDIVLESEFLEPESVVEAEAPSKKPIDLVPGGLPRWWWVEAEAPSKKPIDYGRPNLNVDRSWRDPWRGSRADVQVEVRRGIRSFVLRAVQVVVVVLMLLVVADAKQEQGRRLNEQVRSSGVPGGFLALTEAEQMKALERLPPLLTPVHTLMLVFLGLVLVGTSVGIRLAKRPVGCGGAIVNER